MPSRTRLRSDGAPDPGVTDLDRTGFRPYSCRRRGARSEFHVPAFVSPGNPCPPAHVSDRTGHLTRVSQTLTERVFARTLVAAAVRGPSSTSQPSSHQGTHALPHTSPIGRGT